MSEFKILSAAFVAEIKKIQKAAHDEFEALLEEFHIKSGLIADNVKKGAEAIEVKVETKVETGLETADAALKKDDAPAVGNAAPAAPSPQAGAPESAAAPAPETATQGNDASVQAGALTPAGAAAVGGTVDAPKVPDTPTIGSEGTGTATT